MPAQLDHSMRQRPAGFVRRLERGTPDRRATGLLIPPGSGREPGARAVRL